MESNPVNEKRLLNVLYRRSNRNRAHAAARWPRPTELLHCDLHLYAICQQSPVVSMSQPGSPPRLPSEHALHDGHHQSTFQSPADMKERPQDLQVPVYDIRSSEQLLSTTLAESQEDSAQAVHHRLSPCDCLRDGTQA